MPGRESISLVLLVPLLCPWSEAHAEAEGDRSVPAAASVPGEIEALSLEDLLSPVSGASLYDQPQSQAPSSVSVITREEIARLGYRTLADLLEGLRGFYVSGDRNYSYVGSRGFGLAGDYNSRLRVLVDGHVINDAIFDSWAPDRMFPVDLSRVARVEIIRGPSSSIYGSSAFFGVINIITERPGSRRYDARVALELGSLGEEQIQLGLQSELIAGWWVSLHGSIGHRTGAELLHFPELDPDSAGGSVVHGQDAEAYERVQLSASRGDLALHAVLSHRSKQVPTASYGALPGDPRLETSDGWGYLDLAYDGALSDRVRLTARAHVDQYLYSGTYPYDLRESPDDPPLLDLNVDDARARWWGAEARLGLTLFEDSRLLAGAEIRHAFEIAQRNAYQTSGSVPLDRVDDQLLVAAFVQLDLHLLPPLRLSLGARYDHYLDSFGGAFNPRVAVLLDLTRSTTIKALFGRAFRAPNAYERYYAVEGQILNPALRPETIDTYELVFEQRLLERWRLEISGYFYLLHDLIRLGLNEEELLMFSNDDRVHGLGLEIEVEGRLNPVWVRLSYALQETHSEASDDRLPNSPAHLLKGLFAAPLGTDRLWLSSELVLVGPRLTLSGATAPLSATLNLHLRFEDVIPGVAAALSIKNLLDTPRLDPASAEHAQDVIAQDGRLFFLELSMER
ncbi:MAG: TonB-dependent receptor [Deltaproteobacteria bacterium]|nr:TonB-dependent receptor [Deltaproteobacteria bacterium]